MYDYDDHWTDLEFSEEGICDSAYRKAVRFRTPQAAWNAWDEPGEMLWCLLKRRYDTRPFIRLGLEIVEPVNAILQRSLPKMERFLLVQKKIRSWAKRATEERLQEIVSFMPGMRSVLGHRRIPYHAARAVYLLARCVFQRDEMMNLPLEVGFTLIYAREYFGKPLIPGIENTELSLERIARHQCDIVRKHFPKAPAKFDDY